MSNFEFTAPRMPQIQNSHAVLETIAENQGETTRALLKRLDKLVELQGQQNELLASVLQELQAKRG